MTKDYNKSEVVSIKLEPHPNADALSIVRVYDYTVCCRTSDWTGVEHAVYIPPDSLVDTRRSQFSFLVLDAKYYDDCLTAKDVVRDNTPCYARIKAKKLRGVVSYGLLVPAPEGAAIGEDMTERLGVLHYDAPIASDTGGEVASGPRVLAPKYDVSPFLRLATKLFKDGEAVVVTEKIHGANGRWVYSNGEYFCGSRTEWKKEFPTPQDPDVIALNMRAANEPSEELENNIKKMRERVAHVPQNMWWRALRATPSLVQWLKENPDIVVYGEVYGQVQKGFPYDAKPGEVKIAVFDLYNNGNWVDWDVAKFAAPQLPWVPQFDYNLKFDFNSLVELAPGPSLLARGKHIREGIVVRTLREREDIRYGRVQLKIVSPNFLSKEE